MFQPRLPSKPMSASSRSCPVLLVSAAASGQGKTTVTAALARLHARQGRRVQVFKCGPDFLDPFWLALASGNAVHQLDLWMTGEADCHARLYRAAQQADLVLVEGVMGLYDGEPSAADLARRFGLPVLAVIDASAMAGTFAALAHGLQHYRPGLSWAGVLANHVGGERHAQMLRECLPERAHWLGALMRNGALSLPERHLGLVSALEVDDALARLDAAADALAGTPLGRMDAVALQRWAVSFPVPAEPPAVPPLLAGTTVAVARDRAFCFIYEANLETLHALGAEVVFFSPLADAAVPPCDALWLPGGYPELHIAALAGNRAMRDSLASHVAAGRPVWAECGGMMALFDELVTVDGESHPAWALLPGRVIMQERLAALGPQQLAMGAHSLRGHTFHHSTCVTALPPLARTLRPEGQTVPAASEALYRLGSVRASYFHAWFASSPEATAGLFQTGDRV
jgi:cobyrinic acid a,c-diamide synthase